MFAARVFDVGSYKCLATFVGHEREISKGTFNPSGKRVATASSDKTVRIWDINSGKCLQVRFFIAYCHYNVGGFDCAAIRYDFSYRNYKC